MALHALNQCLRSKIRHFIRHSGGPDFLVSCIKIHVFNQKIDTLSATRAGKFGVSHLKWKSLFGWMHKTIESHLWALGVDFWLLVVIFMNLSVYSGPLTKS